jgi:hypothetical protein
MPNACSGHRTRTLKWRSITFTALSLGPALFDSATEEASRGIEAELHHDPGWIEVQGSRHCSEIVTPSDLPRNPRCIT